VTTNPQIFPHMMHPKEHSRAGRISISHGATGYLLVKSRPRRSSRRRTAAPTSWPRHPRRLPSSNSWPPPHCHHQQQRPPPPSPGPRPPLSSLLPQGMVALPVNRQRRGCALDWRRSPLGLCHGPTAPRLHLALPPRRLLRRQLGLGLAGAASSPGFDPEGS
jgi:hypothetical protein